jgi:hypothetical protein
MKLNFSLISLIYHTLSNKIDTRDDWMLCIKEIHSLEMLSKKILSEDYFEKLFEINEDGEYINFSNVHTIKRLWQKVQEDFPNLRGTTWAERQKQGGQYNVNSFYDDKQLTLFSQEQLDEFSKIDLSKI